MQNAQRRTIHHSSLCIHHSAFRQLLQLLHLARSERPKFARSKTMKCQRAHLDACQIADFVSELCEHSADLAVAPFAKCNFENALVARAMDDADSRARGLEATLVRV